MPDTLWTQQEAATHLRVSVRYLRASTCPKVLLPGNGRTKRRLVRYEPDAVRRWWEGHKVSLQKAG